MASARHRRAVTQLEMAQTAGATPDRDPAHPPRRTVSSISRVERRHRTFAFAVDSDRLARTVAEGDQADNTETRWSFRKF